MNSPASIGLCGIEIVDLLPAGPYHVLASIGLCGIEIMPEGYFITDNGLPQSDCVELK